MAVSTSMSPLFDQLDMLNNIYTNSLEFDKKNTIHIPNTSKIKTSLYPHQVSMLEYMKMYQNRMINGYKYKDQIISGKLGILADKPGTGKTLSCLAHIASTGKEPKPTNELVLHSSRYFFSHNIQSVKDISFCNLVIVPNTLFWQWEEEIKKHTLLKPFLVETRRALNKPNSTNLLLNSDFILTTSRCYKYLSDYAREIGIKWNQVFIDQAESIYFTSNDPILEFQFLWLITTSWLPFIFRNNLSYASNILYIQDRLSLIHNDLIYWLNSVKDDSIQYQSSISASAFYKSYLPYNHNARGEIILRSSNDSIKKSIQIFEPIQEIKKCIPYIHSNLLNNGLMLRSIPNKTYIPSLYNAIGLQPYTLNKIIEKDSTRSDILLHKQNDDCSICLDTPVNRTIVKCCNGVFCGECLLRHMQTNNKCPTCRSIINIDSLEWIPHDISSNELVTRELKSRIDTCVEILQGDKSKQVIIYTLYDNIYYQLLGKFTELGITIDKLDSNPYNVEKVVKLFNEGKLQTLCISNVDQVRGLNLTNATHIIFYHTLPFYELRELLIHSAQRLGRVSPLTVIHLESEFDL